MNLASRALAIQEKINLEKKYGSGGLDIGDTGDVKIVIIGGSKEDAEATPVVLAADLPIATLLTYTVPAGFKARVIKLVGNKTKVTTDKPATFQVCDDTTSKIEAHVGLGVYKVVEEDPIHDYEFAAAVVIKLQAVTEAGAAAMFLAMKVVLLVTKI